MAQKQSQPGAEASQNNPPPLTEYAEPLPELTVQVIRRPLENGSFGTVSFSVTAKGDAQPELLRLLTETTDALEMEYGVVRLQNNTRPRLPQL